MASFISLDPNLDMPEAERLINVEKNALVTGAKEVQSKHTGTLEHLYGQLAKSGQERTKTVEGIYKNAGKRVSQVGAEGSQTAMAGSRLVQDKISGMAQRLGLDQNALAEVSGRLSEQASGFDYRNQASMADRVANMASLGKGMTDVSKLASQAANMALAQGKKDLARKISRKVEEAEILALGAKNDFTGVKAAQAARAAEAARREAVSAMKAMIREQKAAAARAASEARSSRSEARAEARFAAWQDDRNRPEETHPFDEYYSGLAGHFGPNAMSYIDARLGGMSQKEAEKMFKTPGGRKLNANDLEPALGRLKMRR